MIGGFFYAASTMKVKSGQKKNQLKFKKKRVEEHSKEIQFRRESTGRGGGGVAVSRFSSRPPQSSTCGAVSESSPRSLQRNVGRLRNHATNRILLLYDVHISSTHILLFYICLSVRTLLLCRRQNLPEICTLFCLVSIK